MPSKDTKTITIRVPKRDYYTFLKLASEKQQPISTYLKSCLTDYTNRFGDQSKSFIQPDIPVQPTNLKNPILFLKLINPLSDAKGSGISSLEGLDDLYISDEFQGNLYQKVSGNAIGMSMIVKKVPYYQHQTRVKYENETDKWFFSSYGRNLVKDEEIAIWREAKYSEHTLVLPINILNT
jgi:hypothetical protein